MIYDLQAVFCVRRNGTVIERRGSIKQYKREPIDDAAGDMPRITLISGEDHQKYKTCKTEDQPNTVGQRVSDLFDIEFLDPCSHHGFDLFMIYERAITA